MLGLINKCDQLAQTFDSTFESSCLLLRNLANSSSSSMTMDEVLMKLRETLGKCEAIVTEMLNCIYQDIPHLLDQLDNNQNNSNNNEVVTVGNWNPKQALDSISLLFYVSSPPQPPPPTSFHYLLLLPIDRKRTNKGTEHYLSDTTMIDVWMNGWVDSRIKNCCWKNASC